MGSQEEAVDITRSEPPGGELEQELQAAAPPASPAEEEKTRRQLLAELEALRKEIQALTPDYQPPPFSARRLMRFVGDTLNRYPREVQLGVLERLRAALSQDAFDPEVWQGVWYMLNYSVQYNVDLVKRRFTGEYDTDEWGLDWEWVDVVRPFLNFLYKTYWRVEVTGLEHVPLEGRALLVANHSGQLPFDGMMIAAALLNDHPAQRLVRTLYAAILPRIPWVSTVLVRLGQTLATVDNGTRLLQQEELVAVFPEGYKGTGKSFRNRYRLARFGRGGFVQMALNTGAPIIPVSVVGSEETYISLGKFPTFAEITGIPYIPITLRFPWLGLLGVIPLPTKWYIDFGPPMPMAGYGRDAAHDMVVVSQLTDQVRNTIQEMVNQRLAQRRSIFL